jgi:hypothetical protein
MIVKTNPDLFEKTETNIVETDPNRLITQREMKARFKYQESSSDYTCLNCQFNKERRHKFFFCFLFGHRNPKYAICEKFKLKR